MTINFSSTVYSGQTSTHSVSSQVSKAQFDQWMQNLSNWGCWGKRDQLGALNLITRAKKVAATKLVTLGKTVLMARDIALLSSDIPQGIGPIEGVGYPIHIFALVGLGVHLFDNLGLEALAETANNLGRWGFMLMNCVPAISKNATNA